MEFHEIDMQGRFWIEGRSSLPTWHSSYQRRLIYVTSDGTFWFGGSSGWIRVSTGASIATGSNEFISKLVADEHAGTITPSADNSIDLGASSYRYANVYAVSFQGVTTTATYADLAEKYTMEEKYPVGTVMMISPNSEYDLECATYASDVVGVISENPGFIMNNDSDGHEVALVGKVPVRVIGCISKSQPIMAGYGGVAKKSTGDKFTFGYSLETNLDEGEKLVQCIIK